MTTLHIYFTNVLQSEDVAFTRLLTFGARALGRMSINNPGNVLDDRIAAVTSALAGAETGVSDVETKAAVKTAKTLVKNNFRGGLQGTIRRIHGAVVGAYGDPSAELQECFPNGRSVFQTCKDEELNNKLDQLVACITPLQAQVGATIVTLATTAKTQWATIYGAQGTAKDTHQFTAESTAAARASLELELYLSILFVAQQFPGDIAKCDYYFPQQLLKRPSPRTVPDQATLTADPFDGASRKVTLHGSADGAEKIRFERRLAGEVGFATVAEVDAEGGVADFEDTLATDGTYEYQASGLKGASAGEASALLTVTAA